MTTRRTFVRIIPASAIYTAAGASLLAACSDKAPPPAAAPVPAAPAPATGGAVFGGSPTVTSTTAPATPAPAAPSAPAAAAGPMVDEKDATAVALGYQSDGSRVDKAKFPKYAAGQACSGCVLYQGQAGAAAGPCPLFAGKQVSANGWCNSYVKKG